MSNISPFEHPEITIADIQWATETLGLPVDAFDAPRIDVLQSMDSLDIEACPGSGKTTLLVAKLAILAKKWKHRRRGICVLSHTNVARREIEEKLSNTAAGQRLLTYPHYVGTIHGFVNEFLALPQLRSKGITANIDNAFCFQKIKESIWYSATLNKNDKVRFSYINQQNYLKFSNLNWIFHNNTLEISPIFPQAKFLGFSPNTTLENIQKFQRNIKTRATEDGYHTHDDMFAVAHVLIERNECLIRALRCRFPLLFIDEVQDNSELQSGILHRVFVAGSTPVVRQRFGDINQAIFNHADQSEGAITDAFPLEDICKDIPNSHRFDQEIADLVKPLGLNPQDLRGQGPDSRSKFGDTARKNAIFLFDDASVEKILEAYGGYIGEVFSETALAQGIFTAIGAVHKPKESEKRPHFVGHYWSGYDWEISRPDSQPGKFIQYIQAGQKMSQESGESYQAIAKIAEGLCRLARIANTTADIRNRNRKHRYIEELLVDNRAALANYRQLVRHVAVDRNGLTGDEWTQVWQAKVMEIIQVMCGGAADFSQATEFLEWANVEAVSGENGVKRYDRDNFVRVWTKGREIKIRVGSIHSVKGETHTGTLVLETYYKAYHLNSIKKWVLGNSGTERQRDGVAGRLKLHYVAMTRPTHLLCLAMKRESFDDKEISILKNQGWKVAEVVGPEGAVKWL